MTVQAAKGVNALANPEERKKFKAALVDLTHQYQLIDDRRETIKEAIAELSNQYGVEKKHIRKLAVTLHKHNYGELRKQNQTFEAFYELIVEGQLRKDGDLDPNADPLDAEDDE